MSAQRNPRVLGASEGEFLGSAGVRDRFMIDGADTGGRFALVQHLFEPHALAAPVHRHPAHDQYTYVLSGTVGFKLGECEVVAGPGDLVFKPRAQWNTFWNATGEPASVLEIISPAGLEDAFREMGSLDHEPTIEELNAIAVSYGCEFDFEATAVLIERHGLRF
ncbi:MAG: cupin domain-containing protein [Dehalococcoidia bacterium]